MDLAITIAAIVVFGGLTGFAGWKSGRPPTFTHKTQWVSWPLVTVLAATAAIFAIIHLISLMGYHTGGNTLAPYGG